MNFMRIGDELVNLDLLENAQYVESGGHLFLTKGSGATRQFGGGDAQRAWATLTALAPGGDAPPSVGEPNRAAEAGAVFPTPLLAVPEGLAARAAARLSDLTGVPWRAISPADWRADVPAELHRELAGALRTASRLGAVELLARLNCIAAMVAIPGDDGDGDEDGDEDDDDAPAGPAYYIWQPGGPPDRPAGPREGRWHDLGSLRDRAADMAAQRRRGVFPVWVDREPWGTLRIEGPDDWEIRAADGSVIVLPGAFIL